MSATYTVKGYRSAENPTYQKHLRIFRVCKEEQVSLPEETAEYFEHYNIDYLDPEQALSFEIPFQEVNPNEGSHGWEVFLDQLPKGTEKIRFEINC
jgi:hypothetical protein